MVLADSFYYQPVQIDTINTRVNADLFAKEGDANGRGMVVQITENGIIKDTTGITLRLQWSHISVGVSGFTDFEVVDATKGLYKLVYPTSMLHRGRVEAFIRITDNGILSGTRNLLITVERMVGSDETIEAADDYSALQTALTRLSIWEATISGKVDTWEADMEATKQLYIDTLAAAEAGYPQELVSLKSELAEIDSQVDLLNRGLGETFTTLIALQTAYPTGDTKDHIVGADGHRYFWNGTAWADGGAYQAIELTDGAVTPKKTAFMNFSENLFNKSDVGITTGRFINNLGNQSAAVGYSISGYIPAKANDVFTHKFNSGKLGTNTTFTYHDETKTKLGYASGTISGDKLTATITAPNDVNIKYIRVTYMIADANTFMFVSGATYPSAYQNYGEASLKDGVVFSPTQITKIQSVTSANKLYGKIIAFDGDSICYGAGYVGGYGKIIADRNGMIYENKGVSGATIASGTAASHQISKTVGALRSDADYVIFEGIVNDRSIVPAVSLGVMTNGYNDTYDHTTALGGMEYMFSQAVARFPGKKIGFILVHRLWANSDAFHTTWYPAIKAVCQKWGIGFCDLYSEIPSLNLIAALKSGYTHNGDGWHPNQAGYEKYYCDKIEDWLRTL